MVYCGKASTACKHCRTRRIKCDRAEPECGQCRRAKKTCPGYRDQLSLMFRDESSKVMKKAQAQWQPEGGSQASASAAGASSSGPSSDSCSPSDCSSSSDSSSSPTSTATAHFDDPALVMLPSPLTPAIVSRALANTPHSSLCFPPSSSTTASTSPSSTKKHRRAPPSRALALPSPLASEVKTSLVDLGFRFYLESYIFGHPDEPQSGVHDDIFGVIFDPRLRNINSAVGLAAYANTLGDRSVQLAAHQKYVDALKTAGELIKNASEVPVMVVVRSVVTLAMYEIVHGSSIRSTTSYAHLRGAAAVLRRFVPFKITPRSGYRILLQLCYSTFLHLQVVDMACPELFRECVSFCYDNLTGPDRMAALLALHVIEYLSIRNTLVEAPLADASAATYDLLTRLLHLDTCLSNWAAEALASERWAFKVQTNTSLPDGLLFEDEHHTYLDMWSARVWNHYRWLCILTNENLLGMVEKFPETSLRAVAVSRQARIQETIRLCCRDVLVSVAAHWRHPGLNIAGHLRVVDPQATGTGGSGVPILLQQIKTAVCAPGIPRRYWDWAYKMGEAVWGTMGMMHARRMMEELRAHMEEKMRSKPTSSRITAV